MRRSILVVAALGLCGCRFQIEPTGPVKHESQSIDLDKSERARVELSMGAGELTVRGGSPKLLEAEFDYNVPAWKPLVKYNSSGFRADLSVSQPRGLSGGSNITYKWNLRLTDTLPLDVVARLGAGEARMDLGTLKLRNLEVNMGVGQLRLDLRGAPKHSYDVAIHGGVGEATVFVPRSVGVIANAKGGIGDVSVRGLEKRGAQWVNPAHE